MIWPEARSLPRPPPSTPALLETTVRLVICGFFSSSLIRVSGTPLRPKPPARRVLFERRSWMAAAADGNTAGGG